MDTPMTDVSPGPRVIEKRKCTCIKHAHNIYDHDCEHEFYTIDESTPFLNFGIRDKNPSQKTHFDSACFEACPPLALATTAISWFTKDTEDSEPFDEHQRIALEEWQNWDRETANRKGYAWISTLFAIFDDLFFRGSIRNTTIVIQRKLGEGYYGAKSVADTDWVELKGETTVFSQIRIAPEQCVESGRHGEGRLEAIAGALLHEMAHVFLGLYTCKGIPPDDEDEDIPEHVRRRLESCVKYKRSCHVLRPDNYGDGHGHGRQWHMLTQAIEKASKTLLGFDVELILRSPVDVQDEISAPSCWIPSSCDVSQLFPESWYAEIEPACQEMFDKRRKVSDKLEEKREKSRISSKKWYEKNKTIIAERRKRKLPLTPEKKKRKREAFPTPESDDAEVDFQGRDDTKEDDLGS
jgi:hypothetical protein